MNKTKIEWCDSTWNPVTGCLHNCPYCYARKIANRFGQNTDIEFNPETTVDLITKADNPYPYGFHPTFHRYRLSDPIYKTIQNIFVCSMADLFGEWVPDEWIDKVFRACEKAYQHRYLFLTKNPSRYKEVYRSELDYRYNYWFGTTATDDKSFEECGYELFEASGATDKRHANRFMSIEPLSERIKEASLQNVEHLDWVIIGAETGNRKDKVIPHPGWIVDIAEACKSNNVPVFMKDSLVPVIGERNMLREFPEGLQKPIV